MGIGNPTPFSSWARGKLLLFLEAVFLFFPGIPLRGEVTGEPPGISMLFIRMKGASRLSKDLPLALPFLSPPGFLSGDLGPLLTLRPYHPPGVIRPFIGTHPPSRGDLKVLVIPIAFSDLPPNPDRTSDPNYLQALFFGGSLYPYASLRDYYLHESQGLLNVTGTVLPWGRSSQTREGIACRRGSITDCSQACYGLGSLTGTGYIAQGGAIFLVGEALQYAVDQGISLFDYDQNRDGVLDAVIVVHSGRGAEMTNNCRDLWSHQNEATFTVNIFGNPASVQVHYLLGAERFYWPRTQQEFPSGIGVFAHEFGHILGLPDLYNISGGSPQMVGYGVGYYSLMSWGLYRLDGVMPKDNFGPDVLPMALDPWSLERLGWVSPQPVTTNLCLTSLPAFDITATVVSFPLNPSGSERFLLQYVRNNGFREPIRRSGLLIWHIDDAMGAINPFGNSSNCIPTEQSCASLHPWVALLQADGRYDLERGQNFGDPQDLYSEGQCLSDQTVPRSRRWDGTDPGVRICVLSLSKGVEARLNLVVDPSSLPQPPKILNKPAETALVGRQYLFSPKLLDPRGALFTLTRKPEGMTVATDTGIVEWIPTQPGSYPVSLRVENCSGIEELSFTIVVLPPSSGTSKQGCSCAFSSPSSGVSGGLGPLLFLLIYLIWRKKDIRRGYSPKKDSAILISDEEHKPR